jgi:hypothetical protein
MRGEVKFWVRYTAIMSAVMAGLVLILPWILVGTTRYLEWVTGVMRCVK